MCVCLQLTHFFHNFRIAASIRSSYDYHLFFVLNVCLGLYMVGSSDHVRVVVGVVGHPLMGYNCVGGGKTRKGLDISWGT